MRGQRVSPGRCRLAAGKLSGLYEGWEEISCNWSPMEPSPGRWVDTVQPRPPHNGGMNGDTLGVTGDHIAITAADNTAATGAAIPGPS